MWKQLLILGTLFVVGCGAPSHEGADVLNDGLGDGGNTPSAAASREAFKTTLYPFVRTNCSQCHGINQSPMFALPDLQQAFNNLTNFQLANLQNPGASYMVQKLQSGHNNFPTTWPAEVTNLISQWAQILAQNPGDGGGETPEAPESGTFQSISKKILVPKCLSCHNLDNAQKGVRFDTYVATMQTVVAGSPSTSPIYTEVSSGQMPQSPNPKLSDAEISEISSWIQSGALNN